MNRSFYARHAWRIIVGLMALIPAILWGVQQTFEHANNNVSQWLPQDYPETRTYQEFRRLFGSDDMAVVSWEGCTLDDDRLESSPSSWSLRPKNAAQGTGRSGFRKSSRASGCWKT